MTPCNAIRHIFSMYKQDYYIEKKKKEEAPVAQSVERSTANPTTPAGAWFNPQSERIFVRPPVHPAVMGSWSI